MKVTTEIRSGKTGASTRTTVDGEPKNEAERIIFTCLQAGINAALDRAERELAARATEKQIIVEAPKVAAKIVSITEGKLE